MSQPLDLVYVYECTCGEKWEEPYDVIPLPHCPKCRNLAYLTGIHSKVTEEEDD
jgi:hypothetical protein